MTTVWDRILELQDGFYPDWRTKLPRTLFASGLAGETGEVCGTVTHLDGGGTNTKKYSRKQILHQCVDVYVQTVLLLEKSGFSELDFLRELSHVVYSELPSRLKERVLKK